jgi:hypothetical protein
MESFVTILIMMYENKKKIKYGDKNDLMQKV